MQETQEMQLLSLGQEDTLEEEMVTHSSILAWEILRTEESGGLQSVGSQRVRHDLVTKQQVSHLPCVGTAQLVSNFLSERIALFICSQLSVGESVGRSLLC